MCLIFSSGSTQQETQLNRSLSNRDCYSRQGMLQFFPCVAKNLRVHSHLPACPEAKGEKSSHGVERSRQFSLGANDSCEAVVNHDATKKNLSKSRALHRMREVSRRESHRRKSKK